MADWEARLDITAPSFWAVTATTGNGSMEGDWRGSLAGSLTGIIGRTTRSRRAAEPWYEQRLTSRQRQKASGRDPTLNQARCDNVLQRQQKPQFQVSNSSGHHHCLLLCNKSLAKTTIGTQYLDTRQRPAAKPHQTAGIGRARLPANTEVMASPTIRTLTLLSKSLLYPLFDR